MTTVSIDDLSAVRPAVARYLTVHGDLSAILEVLHFLDFPPPSASVYLAVWNSMGNDLSDLKDKNKDKKQHLYSAYNVLGYTGAWRWTD